MNTCIRLCTFDVTNTLLKFRIPVGEQYARVAKMYGVERDPDTITTAFRHYWKIMNKNHPNYGQGSGLTSYDWWKLLTQKVFLHDSHELTEKELNSISSHLYDLYKGNTCWEVTPGAKSLLKYLKQKQVTLGVISNFDERLDHVLTSNDLKPYFDFVLASYVVKIAKPDRKIFDLALGNCIGISQSEALYIGDNVELDYLAAKNAGWNALLLATNNSIDEMPETLNPKDVIHNIEHIKEFINVSGHSLV